MVALNKKTTQVHYSEFHAFCNHQVYIYFIYVFLYFIYSKTADSRACVRDHFNFKFKCKLLQCYA